MKKVQFIQGITRIGTDFLAGFLAWNLAYFIRPWTDLIPNVQHIFPVENLPNPEFFLGFSLASSLGLLLIFSAQQLYSYPAKYLTFHIIPKIFWGVFLWTLCIVAVYSLVFHEQIFSRIMLAHAGIFTVILSIFFRGILRILFETFFRSSKTALLIGNPEKTHLFKIALQNSEYTNIQEISYHEFSEKKFPENIHEIFFFEDKNYQPLASQIKAYSISSGKILHTIPENSLEFVGHSSFDIIRGYALITTLPHQEKLWWSFFKRIFDITFSLFFLILFSPVFLVLALLIKKDSGSWNASVFYISKRVGRNGKIFKMWKFRSMQINADQKKSALEKSSHRDGPLFKIKNDPRITPFGKFLRKTSLDEIPQFINVFLGNMSVIGPRPHLPKEVEKYSPLQKRVLAGKPGISGLAQVSGRSDLSFEDEISLDSYYIEHSSFFLDMKIFLKTPFVLLFGKGND